MPIPPVRSCRVAEDVDETHLKNVCRVAIEAIQDDLLEQAGYTLIEAIRFGNEVWAFPTTVEDITHARETARAAGRPWQPEDFAACREANSPPS